MKAKRGRPAPDVTVTMCRCNNSQNGGICPVCGVEVTLPYRCENCKRDMAEKRCPLCGLKAKRP